MLQAADYDHRETIGVFKNKDEAEKAKKKFKHYEIDNLLIIPVPLLESSEDLDINFIYNLRLIYKVESDKYILQKDFTNKSMIDEDVFKNYNCYENCRTYFQNSDHTDTELQATVESKKSFWDAYKKAKKLIKENKAKLLQISAYTFKCGAF